MYIPLLPCALGCLGMPVRPSGLGAVIGSVGDRCTPGTKGLPVIPEFGCLGPVNPPDGSTVFVPNGGSTSIN